ncbi:MAG: hypothetical protein KVP17_002552 [Porospora cf. gigantea B]|uniref:uncharacterized protein n=2 Tax=Porospora cf. gigantea B TaxID=2853592 RepID=UPI003571FAC4|nr:MAG: hypothetical protein KVP17_002552 [Porospora cf. gigantea B]
MPPKFSDVQKKVIAALPLPEPNLARGTNLRNWCFTQFEIFDEKETHPHNPHMWYDSQPKVRRVVFQLEECPRTKTLHFQGYLELNVSVKISWLREHLSPGAYWTARWSKLASKAVGYCTKEESRYQGNTSGPFFYGVEAPKPKKKKSYTVEDVMRDCRCLSLRELIETQPAAYLRWAHHMNKARQVILAEMAHQKPLCLWFWGSTGAGKSDFISRVVPDDVTIRKPLENSTFFEGYDPVQHRCLVFEDYREKTYPFNLLMQLADHEPPLLSQKGSSMPFRSDVIVVTTRRYISATFKASEPDEDMRQLQRRFVQVEFPIHKSVFVLLVDRVTRRLWLGSVMRQKYDPAVHGAQDSEMLEPDKACFTSYVADLRSRGREKRRWFFALATNAACAEPLPLPPLKVLNIPGIAEFCSLASERGQAVPDDYVAFVKQSDERRTLFKELVRAMDQSHLPPNDRDLLDDCVW